MVVSASAIYRVYHTILLFCRNPDESSEAEEVLGLVESDVEDQYCSEEGDDLKNVCGNIKEESMQKKKSNKKRVVLLNDSDNDFQDDVENEVEEQKNKEDIDQSKDWCKTFAVNNLPSFSFSFGIEWNSSFEV